MTFFTYNGISSADFGLHIESKNIFSAPEYDISFQSIPGRSGDLIVSNNRFANVKVTYTVFVKMCIRDSGKVILSEGIKLLKMGA